MWNLVRHYSHQCLLTHRTGGNRGHESGLHIVWLDMLNEGFKEELEGWKDDGVGTSEHERRQSILPTQSKRRVRARAHAMRRSMTDLSVDEESFEGPDIFLELEEP